MKLHSLFNRLLIESTIAITSLYISFQGAPFKESCSLYCPVHCKQLLKRPVLCASTLPCISNSWWKVSLLHFIALHFISRGTVQRWFRLKLSITLQSAIEDTCTMHFKQLIKGFSTTFHCIAFHFKGHCSKMVSARYCPVHCKQLMNGYVLHQYIALHFKGQCSSVNEEVCTTLHFTTFQGVMLVR